MKYRKFGKISDKISVLGFGAMRMPVNPDGTINEAEAIKMIRHSIDNGVNYVDTAYMYHGGMSEVIVGKALKDGYRERVLLADKSPIGMIKTAEQFDAILDEQLKKLDTPYIDLYLMHGIGIGGLKRIQELGLFEKAEAAKAAGKIKHIGFSFHDKPEAFIKIIDAYDKWEFAQIQYNYMDTHNNAGTAGMKYAYEKGIPIVVMEPILGGRLARPPKAIQEVFDSASKQRTPADWALQWVWDHPEVSVILSGMSTFEQVEQNLKSAENSAEKTMTDAEFEIIAKVRKLFEERTLVNCTKCDYCAPCPNNVLISWIFELYNNGKIYDDPGGSRYAYNNFVPKDSRAVMCTACGVCESKCPQNIKISELMPKVHEVLGENKDYQQNIT